MHNELTHLYGKIVLVMPKIDGIEYVALQKKDIGTLRPNIYGTLESDTDRFVIITNPEYTNIKIKQNCQYLW